MESQEQIRARLKGILDRIGPDLWLTVTDSFLVAAFGDEATITKAKRFAHENNCAFRYEEEKYRGDGVGIFGRAYYKKSRSITISKDSNDNTNE